MTETQRIMIVAENASQRKFMVRVLEQHGLRVESAANCEAACRQLFDGQFAAVVIDLTSSLKAIELIKRVCATELGETRLLVTGEWGTSQPTLALSQGTDAYEPAPFDERRLIDSVERVLHHQAVVVE